MAPAGSSSTSFSGPSSSSRAMDIPNTLDTYNQSSSTYPYNRRRRGQYSKIPSPVQRTDTQAGPSSSSASSDASWFSPPRNTTSRPITRTGPEAKDPRLPTRPNPYTEQQHPTTPQRKDKGPLRPSSTNTTTTSSSSLPPLFPPTASPLSPSMLASSSYTSVNLNHHYHHHSHHHHSSSPDSDLDDDLDASSSPPRLITYTKHSQGFTWNDELFLPSYLLGRYAGRGRRRHDGDFGEDDVHVVDVFVTDEEAAAMMP